MVAFDYADKVFITLAASFGTLSIASYATVVGIPAGIAGASLTLIFTLTTSVVKTLISQALIEFEITHEEFSKIIYEKNNYEQIIDNIRSVQSINDLNKKNDLNK